MPRPGSTCVAVRTRRRMLRPGSTCVAVRTRRRMLRPGSTCVAVRTRRRMLRPYEALVCPTRSVVDGVHVVLGIDHGLDHGRPICVERLGYRGFERVGAA